MLLYASMKGIYSLPFTLYTLLFTSDNTSQSSYI